MSNKIVNLATLTAAADAATKGYVDAAGAAPGYTACYVTNCAGVATCATGYTKILSTSGTGCTGPTGTEKPGIITLASTPAIISRGAPNMANL